MNSNHLICKRAAWVAVAILALWSFAGGVGAGVGVLRAQDKEPDAEGCKDSSLITRFPGSVLTACDNKEYEQMQVKTGQSKSGEETFQTLEGEYHKYDYETREGTSQIQVFRNMETALRAAGFSIVYEDSPGAITARKGSTWYNLDNDGGAYRQVIITTKEMTQEVTADASSLANEIEKSGRVAIYGIHFDTGKATIQPDSEQILDQIVKLLSDNGDLKLRVEGYTDNVGAAAANQALSEKRAQAVVAWLVAHGVSSARLAAKGLGQGNPVADNGTEDGRAKNRRVELAKM